MTTSGNGYGFTTQTEQLHCTAPQYDSVAQQVQQIYQMLISALDDEGACWGNDAQGQTFGAKYCQPAVSLLEQMGNTQQGLQSMVDGVCSWAKNYVDADQAATASASQIGTTDGTDS
jgi:uncharacterized protein YukE